MFRKVQCMCCPSQQQRWGSECAIPRQPIFMLWKAHGIKQDHFIKYISCWKCYKLYTHDCEECYITLWKACSHRTECFHVELQNHKQGGRKKVCGWKARCIHSHREIVPHRSITLQQTRLQSWWENYCCPKVVPLPAALASNMAAIGFGEEENLELAAWSGVSLPLFLDMSVFVAPPPVSACCASLSSRISNWSISTCMHLLLDRFHVMPLACI